MKGMLHMIHDSLIDLGIVVLVLLAILVLPVAAVLTRALIPATVAVLAVLFVASCFSRRMQHWLYS
jgi:hypothetical protein